MTVVVNIRGSGWIAGRQVRRGDAAVDEKIGAGDVTTRRRPRERGRLGDPIGAREPSHRDMRQSTIRLLGAEERAQHRRLHRTWAQRVGADAPPGKLDRDLPRQREHRALGGGVADLRLGRTVRPPSPTRR